MEKQNLLQDVAVEKRAEMLLGMADKSQIEKVKRFYSEDEKLQMKDFLSEESIELMDKNEQFSEIKKEFNAKMKTFKEGINRALKSLKKGYSEEEESVFLIADNDNGVMDVYDSKGEYLYTRKMFNDERQTTIISMVEKTGTNN